MSAPFISVNQNILSKISRIIIWGEIPTITILYAYTASPAIMLLILATTPRPALFLPRQCRWSTLPYSCVGELGAYSALLGQREIRLKISFHREGSDVIFFFLYNGLVGKSVNCSIDLLFRGCWIVKNITIYYFLNFSLRRLLSYASLYTFSFALWINAVVFDKGFV